MVEIEIGFFMVGIIGQINSTDLTGGEIQMVIKYSQNSADLTGNRNTTS
jgi:hypothetical protein